MDLYIYKWLYKYFIVVIIAMENYFVCGPTRFRAKGSFTPQKPQK